MIKAAGMIVALMGLALIVFAFFARGELQSAATSMAAPKPGDFRLLKFVGPELFTPPPAADGEPAKPAELATNVANRIYLVGGFGGLMVLVGGALLMLRLKRD